MSIAISPELFPTRSRWLRVSLLIDAAVTGANGLAYVVAATLLTTVLGPPVPFLIGIGVFLSCYAAAILRVGRAQPIPVGGVWFAVLLNASWALVSVLHAATADWLTTVGRVWGVLQAGVVLGFAIAQVIGLRRDHSGVGHGSRIADRRDSF